MIDSWLDITDLALLTKAREHLAQDDVILIEGIWSGPVGCCTLGAATLPWQADFGRRTSWKQPLRRRVAALLVPHMDAHLVNTTLNAGSEHADEIIRVVLDNDFDPLHRITAYSDYVLYPRMDGKARAIELYDRAIAAAKEAANAEAH